MMPNLRTGRCVDGRIPLVMGIITLIAVAMACCCGCGLPPMHPPTEADLDEIRGYSVDRSERSEQAGIANIGKPQYEINVTVYRFDDGHEKYRVWSRNLARPEDPPITPEQQRLAGEFLILQATPPGGP